MLKWGQKVRSASRGTPRSVATEDAAGPDRPEAPVPTMAFGGLEHLLPLLVLVDDDGPVPALDALEGPGTEVLRLSEATEPHYRGAHRSVLLVTADRASLRRVVPRLPLLGRGRSAACWLHAEPTGFAPVLGPLWPPVHSLASQPLGDGVAVGVRLRGPVRLVEVLRALAAGCTDARPSTGGLTVCAVPAAPYAGPAGLVDRAADLDDALSPERVVPPDVVLTGPGRVEEPAPHPTTARPPVLVAPDDVEPVDEYVHNPRGFDATADGPVVDAAGLAALGATDRLPLAALAALRGSAGVRLTLGDVPTRLVLELAASGVPLDVAGTDPALSPELAAALAAPADLSGPEERELRSLTVRRAALETHGTHAWRRRLAARAGVALSEHPPTSVVLATKRAEQLEFALRQVARQDVDAQLVLAAHGFTPDHGRVADVLGDRPHVVVERPADAVFGDVLNAAVAAADGELLVKMDDDDWYSPRFLRDLLLARRYSGAEVVGMSAEFVHLAELDVTVRRNHRSEILTTFVAGGTMMVERDLLVRVGGYRRVVRHVDAQLLEAARASGARVYRTHGLGYVLHRRSSGHTWDMSAEEFRREGTVAAEWPGFRPSAEIEVAAEDRP